MAMIPLRCTNCGANLEVNDSLEKAFCNYCGAMFLISEAISKKQVLDESHKIEPLLELANSALKTGEYEKCSEKADEVIVLQQDNAEAWYLKGCAAASLGNPNCTEYWQKAYGYADDGSSLKNKIAFRLDKPKDFVKVEKRQIKVVIDKIPALVQPKYNVVVDGEKVLQVKCGDLEVGEITPGKHEILVRKNGALIGGWKYKILVEKKDVQIFIRYNKRENNLTLDTEC